METNAAVAERSLIVRNRDDAREAPTPMVLQVDNGDDDSSGALSLSALWHAFAKRVWVAAPLGFPFAAVACAVLGYITEPRYKSVATLKIVDKQPYVAF